MKEEKLFRDTKKSLLMLVLNYRVWNTAMSVMGFLLESFLPQFGELVTYIYIKEPIPLAQKIHTFLKTVNCNDFFSPDLSEWTISIFLFEIVFQKENNIKRKKHEV